MPSKEMKSRMPWAAAGRARAETPAASVRRIATHARPGDFTATARRRRPRSAPCSPSAVVVLAEHVGRDLARLEIVTATLEAGELTPVHVDLHGGAVARIVELVDLVHIGNEQRDLARLDEHGPVLLEDGVIRSGPVVHAPEARLLDGVAHHA